VAIKIFGSGKKAYPCTIRSGGPSYHLFWGKFLGRKKGEKNEKRASHMIHVNRIKKDSAQRDAARCGKDDLEHSIKREESCKERGKDSKQNHLRGTTASEKLRAKGEKCFSRLEGKKAVHRMILAIVGEEGRMSNKSPRLLHANELKVTEHGPGSRRHRVMEKIAH